MRLAKTLFAIAITVLIAGAGSAEAGKGKKKDPKYTASLAVTGQMSADVDCDTWASNFVYSGEYYPTTLESAASLDARARTASGTIDWTQNSCTEFAESGRCSISAISPPPGPHAGDEDAFLQKADGGLRVNVEFVQFLEVVGETCRGAIYSGAQGQDLVETQGFIPAGKIGRKVITVPIAGSFTFVDGSEHADGQMNGTLTLTRKGKKKGK